jgi:hypothetical protein
VALQLSDLDEYGRRVFWSDDECGWRARGQRSGSGDKTMADGDKRRGPRCGRGWAEARAPLQPNTAMIVLVATRGGTGKKDRIIVAGIGGRRRACGATFDHFAVLGAALVTGKDLVRDTSRLSSEREDRRYQGGGGEAPRGVETLAHQVRQCQPD